MKKLHALYLRVFARLRTIWRDEKQRVNLLLCVGVTGMLLLALSTWLPAAPEPQTSTTAQTEDPGDYAVSLERRLRELIEQVEGAGSTQVMVTLQTGQSSVYATDTDTSADGTASTSHVVVSGNALLETVAPPNVLGVAVVCEGGGDPAVQNRVSMLVETLTGVGANHITVAKMATTN